MGRILAGVLPDGGRGGAGVSPAAGGAFAGAVLAGGRGRRLGGASKACVELSRRPLLSYPLAALVGAGVRRVAVVCKRATDLPALPEGVERWDEPDEPSHPALGIAAALEAAGGPVLVVAADMPWVGVEDCRRLLAAVAAEPGAAALVAASGQRVQPVLGVYGPAALPGLKAAARDGARLTDAVEALRPAICELPAGALRGVNTPGELEAAAAELAAGDWVSGARAARSRPR